MAHSGTDSSSINSSNAVYRQRLCRQYLSKTTELSLDCDLIHHDV